MIRRTMTEIIEALNSDVRARKKLKGDITLELLAKELLIPARRLRVQKTRGTIPHEIVLDYCLRKRINPLKIFYSKA